MQRKTLDEHLGAFIPPLLSGIRLAPVRLRARLILWIKTTCTGTRCVQLILAALLRAPMAANMQFHMRPPSVKD